MDTEIRKFGRFEVQREIGRGAMGIVYLALDPALQRPVAIKSLRLAGSEADLSPVQQRFIEEARAAARLNHPNIVTVYEVGQQDGQAYIAMEYLEGKELKQILAEDPRFTFREIAEIVEQIAESLDYAHCNAIVHRDVKPANIMIVRGNVPKVLDFGIAMPPTGTDDEALKFVGSPKYMSPEQVEGRSIDARSDVFSLGAVMYEMLTRRAPFEGETLTSVIYQILHEMPPPPQTLSGNTPSYLARIVAKALAKKPEERYQNAAQMAADLRRYAQRAQAKATINKRKTSADVLPSYAPAEPGAPAANEALSRTIQLDGKEARRVQTGRHRRNLVWAGTAAGILILAVGVMASRTGSHGQRNTEAPAPSVAVAQEPAVKPATAPAAESQIALDLRPAPTPPEPEKKAPDKTHNAVAKATKVVVPAKVEPKPPAAPEPATLQLAISPWGEIYLDGAKMGISPPLTQLQTTAGSHRIEIRNGDTQPYVAELSLSANETKRLKFKFE